MSLTQSMWPSSDERMRLEQEMIRDAQERSYMNGRTSVANGVVASPNAQAHSPRENHYMGLQRMQHAQAPPAQFLPTYMGTDAMSYYNSNGATAQGSLSPSIHPHSASVNLLRMRDDTDERHGYHPELFLKQPPNTGAPMVAVAAAASQREEAYSPVAFFDASRMPPVHRSPGSSSAPHTNEAATGIAALARYAETSLKEVEQATSETDDSKPKSRKRGTEEQPRKSKKKDTKWLTTLDELKDYKKEYGNTIVPRGYSQNPRLASWVAEQRKQYKLLHDNKQSSITQDRIDALNELDFAWNAQEAAWARHMSDLRSFQAETGHCHVPLNHPKYPKLGLWVKEQRRHHTLMTQGKPSHMTAERCTELNQLGFCYDTHESTWMERWRELAEYREQHGSCVVPSNHHNTKLATWVHHQRRQFKRLRMGQPCHITKSRIHLLNQLGFVWYPRQTDADDDSSSDEDGDDRDDLSDASDEEPPKKKSNQKKRARRS